MRCLQLSWWNDSLTNEILTWVIHCVDFFWLCHALIPLFFWLRHAPIPLGSIVSSVSCLILRVCFLRWALLLPQPLLIRPVRLLIKQVLHNLSQINFWNHVWNHIWNHVWNNIFWNHFWYHFWKCQIRFWNHHVWLWHSGTTLMHMVRRS